MKTLFIESKLKGNFPKIRKEEISKLPKELFLVYSIQYKELAEKIKSQLENSKIKINNIQQVLGCSEIKTSLPILLIGNGRFHARNLHLYSKDIYILENNKIIQIPNEEIEKTRTKRKTALIKFLSADKIGILVTTKPGQEHLKKAIKLKEDLINNGKKVYIFITNNIDIDQFENFSIDSWVNTACSGLAMDNSDIINYKEIK